MNNKSRLPLYIAAAALLLLGGVLWRMSGAGEEGRFDWQESGWGKKGYDEKNNQPYGTLIAHRLLSEYFPGKRFADIRQSVASQLLLNDSLRANYVFVGEGMYMDSLDTRRLLDFVSLGNTALIVSKTVPFDLMFHLYLQACGEEDWDDYAGYEAADSVGVALSSYTDAPPLFLQYARQNKPASYKWAYIESRFFCDSLPYRPLGHINDSLVNFALFPFGKGRFLLHTNPIAFSNYQLLRPAGRRYAEMLLSYLSEGDIYWDAYSRVPEAVARAGNGGAREQSPQPLAYMLKQPALAWAWYILLGLGALYVVFRAGRRQRAIPILPHKENTSYEFISTIAHLHFKERNYRNMSIQGMKLFLAAIHERYGLAASLDSQTNLPKTDAQFFERLARITAIPQERIRAIFSKYNEAVAHEASERALTAFHMATEEFWREAR